MKYEFREEQLINGHNMHRIVALHDIPMHDVKAGDLGGWVESTWNLSQEGSCWIKDESMAYQLARISDNAIVMGAAEVYETAKVYDEAVINGMVSVFGSARICKNMVVASINDYIVLGPFYDRYVTFAKDSNGKLIHSIIRCGDEIYKYASEVMAYKQMISVHS